MQLLTNYYFILCMHIVLVRALTCDELSKLPKDSKLNFSDLQSMIPKDIVQCLAQLGNRELTSIEADFVWHSIIKLYGDIQSIPDSVLMTLNRITIAISPKDYENMTLSNIDVIQNFGLDYNLNEEQTSAIANRVRQDFAEKEPEDYTYFDLLALRQILCAFNRSEIERIHPLAYKEAASMIGKLERCNDEVMSGFATLAIQKNAFGSHENWTKATIKMVGKVATYLPREFTKNFNYEGEP